MKNSALRFFDGEEDAKSERSASRFFDESVEEPADVERSASRFFDQVEAESESAKVEPEVDFIPTPNIFDIMLDKSSLELQQIKTPEGQRTTHPIDEFDAGEFAPVFTEGQSLDKSWKQVNETLNEFAKLTANPVKFVKGVGELAFSIPGFMIGIPVAAQRAVETAFKQVVEGQIFNLEDVYFAAAEGMQKTMESMQPGVEAVWGKTDEQRALVGAVAMAPLTGLSTLGSEIAGWKGFEDYPNIRGAARFAGDIGGFLALGAVYGRGRKLPVASKIKDVAKKAEGIKIAEEVLEYIPEDVARRAKEKVLEIEKKQLELEIDELKKKIELDAEVKKDLKKKGKKVKEIKEEGIETEAIREGRLEFAKEKAERTEPLEEPSEVVEPKVKLKKIEPKIEEPITNLDRQTGTSLPALEGEQSPFFQSKESTENLKGVYERKAEAVSQDVEIYSQKLINDVNRWYHGDEGIDIAKVRNDLSELATRADELRMNFVGVADFNAWKETVSEVAVWGRRIESDRLKIERRRGEGTKLYSGIPVDEAAKLLKGVYRKVKDRIIKSVNSDQKQILRDIAKLHTKDKIDVDMTYSKGVMWKGTGINPKHKFDKRVEAEEVTKVDILKGLPLSDKSVESVMFDPPFLVESTKVGKERTGIMINRFTAFRTIDELWSFYKKGVNEAFRVLKPGGKLITKTQDITYGNRMWASSSEVYNFATQAGFKPVDRFIYTPKVIMPLPPNVKVQKHARKVHNDFWIFEKPKRSYTYPKEGGVKLYSGLPLDEAGKAIVNAGKAFKGYVDHARGIKRFKPKEAAKALNKEFKRSFIDRSGNIRLELLDKLGDTGYEVIQKMYLTKGAYALSADKLRQMKKEVYGGLSRREKQVFDNLALAERMADIAKYKTEKQFKFPKGLSPVETAAYIELFPYLEKIPPDRAKIIRNRVEAYFEWMKKPLKDMLDAELISKEEYDNLVSHNYRRIKLVDIFDKKYESKIGKKKRTIYDSGIEALAKGRDTDIYEPSSEIMALEVFNRAYGRILNNEAFLSLEEVAINDPKNPFARVKTEGETIPSGWQRHFFYKKGERKSMYLSPEMSKEWITNSPEITYRMGQFLRYTSLSPVLRTFATGINWGFALANLPRDVMHTWYAARTFDGKEWKGVYSPHLPIFLPQIGLDLARIFPDAVTRGKRYKEYIEEGGGMEFLVHQGRIVARGRRLEGPFDKIQDVLGYFGETTEIMTRLAIRDRVIRNRAREKGISIEEARKNKDITKEATFAARDYMDFGQGGGMTKAADNAMPYLNAAVQGTRGLWRVANENPRTFAYKVAQLGATVTLLYSAMREHAPETTEALQGSIDMQNNLCIPIGDSFKFEDEKGQTRYIYWKIPIDPSQKFFKAFFEGATDKMLGNEVDVDRLTNNMMEVSPVGITSLPPTLSGGIGYLYNKDLWRNQDVWKRTKPFDWPESKEEYVPGKTPEFYEDIGKVTGLSPERTGHAIEEITTSGTMWSYLMGKGYEKLFADVPKSQREQHLAMVLSQTPIAKRFIGVTHPYTKYKGEFKEAEQKVDLEHWIQTREVDRLTEGYLFQDSVERREIWKYINTFKEKVVRDRLIERLDFQVAMKDVPERSFWLRLQGLKVPAKAEVYFERWDRIKDDPKKMEQLREESIKVESAGGVFSDRFWDEVGKLRKNE